MTAETTQGFPPHLSLQAHRGAAGLAPENTLAAFRMALELGADGTEMDLQLTRDGVVVVIHDDTVDRTTDGRGRIGDLTLAEVKRLDAGGEVRTDVPRRAHSDAPGTDRSGQGQREGSVPAEPRD